MKIAFRALPFSPAQEQELTCLARAGGYEPAWYRDSEPLHPADLQDCAALVGYFPTDLMPQLPHLRWVQVPCAGVDRYCAVIRSCKNAVLTNCAGAFSTTIAEYMVMGMLMLLRRMPAYAESQRIRAWQYAGPCRTIAGSAVTIVGMGGIGRYLAHILKAMGATVRGVRRRNVPAPADFDEVYLTSQLHDAVRGADVVALCLPGTDETRGLISAECLAQMRPDALLVNCGRGCTVDEQALADALASGRLGGAVLDVTAVEPLPADSPLWSLSNVIITPHISGRDGDGANVSAIWEIIRDNVERFVHRKELTHQVDCCAGY